MPRQPRWLHEKHFAVKHQTRSFDVSLKRSTAEAPAFSGGRSLSAAAKTLVAPWLQSHADDAFADGKTNVTRRLALDIDTILTSANLGRSGLSTIQENADVIAALLPTRSDRWNKLSQLAKAEAAAMLHAKQHVPTRTQTTTVSIEKISFDNSPHEKALFNELFRQLESHRAEIGYWLWPMGAKYLTKDVPVIKNGQDLRDHLLEKSRDINTSRSYFPIRCNGKISGLISCGLHDKKPGELQYWLGKTALGKHVMTRALLQLEKALPEYLPTMEVDGNPVRVRAFSAYVEGHQLASRQIMRTIHAHLSDFTLDPVPPFWLKARRRLNPTEYNFGYHKVLANNENCSDQ